MMSSKLALFTILSSFVIGVSSCKKERGCDSQQYVGNYSGVLAETINNPNFSTEIYTDQNCSLIIDFAPNLGQNKLIEIDGDQVTIPPQTWTSESTLTSDSLAYWKLITIGNGTYKDGVITLNYVKKSNYYDSNALEYYSPNSITLTRIP